MRLLSRAEPTIGEIWSLPEAEMISFLKKQHPAVGRLDDIRFLDLSARLWERSGDTQQYTLSYKGKAPSEEIYAAIAGHLQGRGVVSDADDVKVVIEHEGEIEETKQLSFLLGVGERYRLHANITLQNHNYFAF